jgi:hypothetical protein
MEAFGWFRLTGLLHRNICSASGESHCLIGSGFLLDHQPTVNSYIYPVADVHAKEIRSKNMSRIKGRNTKLEMLVRKF